MHMTWRLLLVFGLWFGLALGAANSKELRRVALVVGNANYQRVQPLQNPVNDARLVASRLEQLGFDTTLRTDLSREQMRAAIAAFQSKIETPGSPAEAVFYYAGHGVQADGRNFLVPVDAYIASKGDLARGAIDVGVVYDALERARSPASIIVLDACRNNPFGDTEALLDGLAPATGPQGALIAFATSPGEVAYDGAGENSPFSRAFAEEISRSGRGVEEVLRAVRVSVLRETESQQLTWDHSSLLQAFVFHDAKGEQPSAERTLAQFADPQAAWFAIRGSANPKLYGTYRSLFPTSPYDGYAAAAALGEEPLTANPIGFELARERRFTPRAEPILLRPRDGAARVGDTVAGGFVRVTGRSRDGKWLSLAVADGELGFLPISATASTPIEDLPITSPRGTRPSFRVGEVADFTVKLRAPSLLFCFLRGAAGEVTQLFPNEYLPDPKLSAGSFRFSDNFPFVLRISEPTGLETVVCFTVRGGFPPEKRPGWLRSEFGVLQVGMAEVETVFRGLYPFGVEEGRLEILVQR